MKKTLFLALLLSASLSFAQSTLKSTASLTAACTNATTACDSIANSQFKLPTGEYSMVSLTAHGTFSGSTIFFEFSDDGGTNWYPSTCTRNDAAIQESSETLTDNTNRSWDCGTAGAGIFRIRQNAITSGTVQLGASQSAIQIEPAPTVSAIGAAAPGTTIVGSPILIAGQSGGTTVRTLLLDTAGALTPSSGASGLGSSALSNTSNAYNTSNGEVVQRVFNYGFNGGLWDGFKTASATTLPTSVTLTARNSSGAEIMEKGSRWTVTSSPAVSTQASASIAAEASVRHVADCVGFSGGSTTAPALTALTVNLRDGATGAGTVLRTWTVIVSASTGQNISPFEFCGLNLVGTTNTAMTLEFSALLTSLLETVNISGFNVN